MSVLFLTPEVEQRVFDLAAYAANHLHWFRPNQSDWSPGDRPEYVLVSGDTKAVFTWTETPEGVLRHLSVSVRTPGKYPNPTVIWTLAHKFGFQGGVPDEHGVVLKPAESWSVGTNEDQRCVVVVQPVPDAKP